MCASTLFRWTEEEKDERGREQDGRGNLAAMMSGEIMAEIDDYLTGNGQAKAGFCKSVTQRKAHGTDEGCDADALGGPTDRCSAADARPCRFRARAMERNVPRR